MDGMPPAFSKPGPRFHALIPIINQARGALDNGSYHDIEIDAVGSLCHAPRPAQGLIA